MFFDTRKYINGWVEPDGEFNSCPVMFHFQALPNRITKKFQPSNYRQAYQKAQKEGYVRITSYYNKDEEFILQVWGREEFFAEHEDTLLNLAYAMRALTTEWIND